MSNKNKIYRQLKVEKKLLTNKLRHNFAIKSFSKLKLKKKESATKLNRI